MFINSGRILCLLWLLVPSTSIGQPTTDNFLFNFRNGIERLDAGYSHCAADCTTEVLVPDGRHRQVRLQLFAQNGSIRLDQFASSDTHHKDHGSAWVVPADRAAFWLRDYGTESWRVMSLSNEKPKRDELTSAIRSIGAPFFSYGSAQGARICDLLTNANAVFDNLSISDDSGHRVLAIEFRWSPPSVASQTKNSRILPLLMDGSIHVLPDQFYAVSYFEIREHYKDAPEIGGLLSSRMDVVYANYISGELPRISEVAISRSTAKDGVIDSSKAVFQSLKFCPEIDPRDFTLEAFGIGTPVARTYTASYVLIMLNVLLAVVLLLRYVLRRPTIRSGSNNE
jgi:hypothetical protein